MFFVHICILDLSMDAERDIPMKHTRKMKNLSNSTLFICFYTESLKSDINLFHGCKSRLGHCQGFWDNILLFYSRYSFPFNSHILVYFLSSFGKIDINYFHGFPCQLTSPPPPKGTLSWNCTGLFTSTLLINQHILIKKVCWKIY